MIDQKKGIWNFLLENGGKTSAELRANFTITADRSTHILREMLARGYVRREEAGLNIKNVMTYRYFANADKPPVGRGNFERRPRVRVRVIGEKGKYSVKKIQGASKGRQAIAMRNIACLPIVKIRA